MATLNPVAGTRLRPSRTRPAWDALSLGLLREPPALDEVAEELEPPLLLRRRRSLGVPANPEDEAAGRVPAPLEPALSHRRHYTRPPAAFGKLGPVTAR